MTDRSLKQIHLAVLFPGVDYTTVWSDPAAGSNISFDSFRHLAATAERGRFDFFFLAEGLRLREVKGRIHDLDVAGRPEAVAVLAALAAVTDRIGLAATLSATFNEPYELARRIASLDHLSAGRAAWNVVTTPDAFTGENFRRGGYLDPADRYTRAAEFLQLAREFWDAEDQPVQHRGPHFDVEGRLSLPRPPQGHPVVIQAGESDEGREFAAAAADVVFSPHNTLAEGRAFHADVKRRLAAYGRKPDELKILPGATFALGDTDAEAAERAAEIRRTQISPQTAIVQLEHVWGIDLSDHDPDGPLPTVDPDPDGRAVRGRTRIGDPLAIAARWRALAAEKNLTSREVVIEVTGRQTFIGSPATVAAQIDHLVQQDAADGFILMPHLLPGGLDEFVDRVVPLLQERGVFRTDYTGPTLRDHLGLPVPGRR
ncbi:LLM class flavin-dependent oxidoreductase [Kitasatospora sp. NPDC097643]|uniref:LLM class flavin-dependent oxidoreductase n=1 Tax=Kitasatospora sp. NPDC097643 TaxID=3157230 RepID=UPI0033333A22